MASRTLGGRGRWILLKHLIPNTMGPIIIELTFSIPNAIFTEATLSYLGLGVPVPLSSWGTLANEGSRMLLDVYKRQAEIRLFSQIESLFDLSFKKYGY